VDHIKGKDDDDTDNIKRIGVLSVIALTFSGGADNIGVYVPLFTGYSVSEILVAAVVFALLTAVWCFIGSKLASLPFVRSFIEKYEHIIVPSVFILLGVYILLEGVL
jgi:cadmium resistance protein CadD (predicted permease)